MQEHTALVETSPPESRKSNINIDSTYFEVVKFWLYCIVLQFGPCQHLHSVVMYQKNAPTEV